MRDGETVHVDEMANVDRLQLIALMLGRDLTDVREHGATAFTSEHDVAGEPVLRAEGLQRAHQLEDVSLDLRPGEVVGLGGLLGSGRSETARAIAGALPLDSGSVTVGGSALRRHSTSAAIKAGVAMLPEDRKTDGIIPNLSVRENIVLAALPRISRAGLVDKGKQDEIVDFFMQRLRIKASSPAQKVGELSGGNQQKVMLARWLCLNPKALLLDEPTRGIDVGAKAEVQSLIDDLAQEGLAVLLISSDLEELIEGSDRIVVLKEGRRVAELRGDEVNQGALMSVLAEDASSDEATADEGTSDEATSDGRVG
jgi:galactofuranose transport system ATP-binding protein